jgi:hypothetical protein
LYITLQYCPELNFWSILKHQSLRIVIVILVWEITYMLQDHGVLCHDAM